MAQSWWVWGRVLYSVPLAITGLIYLINPQGTVESLTSFIPGGNALIYVGGVLWLIFGLAVALGFFRKYALIGIIGLLCAYLIMVHVPAATAGEHLNIVWFELLRNLSLMAGAFFLLMVEEKSQGPSNAQKILTDLENNHYP